MKNKKTNSAKIVYNISPTEKGKTELMLNKIWDKKFPMGGKKEFEKTSKLETNFIAPTVRSKNNKARSHGESLLNTITTKLLKF